MRFEVLECAGEWIVQRDGEEVGRFDQQDAALTFVAGVMRDLPANDGPASLAMRYERRSA